MANEAAERKDLDFAATLFWGVVTVVGTAIIVIALQAYYYNVYDEQAAEANAVPWTDVQKVKADQQTLLTRYLWPADSKSKIHIPIDRAMELVAHDLSVPAPPPQKGTPAKP